MKKKKRVLYNKKKENTEFSKEFFLSSLDGVEKNVVNLLKNKNNSSKNK